MANIKINEERLDISKVSFEQLTDLLMDIKHCSNLLSKACDRSLHQCKKMINDTAEEFQE